MFLPREPSSQSRPFPSFGAANGNRRRFGRIRTLGVPCSLGEVVDISASGMRVVCRGRAALGVGRHGRVSMATPAGMLSAPVRVSWARRCGWWGTEMGIEFVEPSAEVLEGVRSVLRACRVGPAETEAMLRRKVA